MDQYYVVIALTFVGFVALAAILLVPVYLFLKREEEVASRWTDESISRVSDEPLPLEESPADENEEA